MSDTHRAHPAATSLRSATQRCPPFLNSPSRTRRAHLDAPLHMLLPHGIRLGTVSLSDRPGNGHWGLPKHAVERRRCLNFSQDKQEQRGLAIPRQGGGRRGGGRGKEWGGYQRVGVGVGGGESDGWREEWRGCGWRLRVREPGGRTVKNNFFSKRSCSIASLSSCNSSMRSSISSALHTSALSDAASESLSCAILRGAARV